MNEYSPIFYVDGTAALKVSTRSSVQGTTFTAFKCSSERSEHKPVERPVRMAKRPVGFSATVRSIMESSEMFCSLLTEDFRGCAYHVFSNTGIATLATGSAVVAILALVLGA